MVTQLSIGDGTLRYPPVAERTVGQLVADVINQPYGRISLSTYETGRVVALAPNLAGQLERVQFLLSQQRPDGLWGGSEGYALVPTLSVVDALMCTGTHSSAARAGIHALRIWLSRHSREALPDTVAAELIVAVLTAAINSRLADHEQLHVLHGDHETLATLRQQVSSGVAVRDTLLHSLELMSDLASSVPGVHPTNGLVCASPAATAAWLGGRDCGEFDAVLRLYGSVAPAFHPITHFERAWVATWLQGIGTDFHRVLLADSSEGVSTAPGLPIDADTTATTLWAMAAQGRKPSLDPLWRFERADHFTTWLIGEADPSPTTNAHVLEALIAGAPDDRRARTAVGAISRWLLGNQRQDGSWTDKWHASPYYATCCCVLALHRTGLAAIVDPLAAAAAWVLGTQRADGGWGLWHSTAEETAYAVNVLTCLIPFLARTERGLPAHVHQQTSLALGKASNVLSDHRFVNARPALWHDKDLYAPYNIIDAAVLAAKHGLHNYSTRLS